MIDRAVPVDIQAERATLGSILLERDAIIAVAPWLLAEHFYLEKHAHVYEAMLTCYNRRVPPDLATVSDELRRREQIDLVGGLAFLGELAAEVPTAVHIEYYGRIVERTAIQRRLIEVGGRIAALGYDEREELEVTLDKAEAELFTVSQRRNNQDFVHIGQIVNTLFTQIESMQERRGEVVGVPTGYADLDALTGGLQPSDLIILAARPSVGKTSLALSLAYNVALEANNTVAVFSLEMSRDQLVQRILSMHTGIDMQRLRTGNVRGDELQLALEGMGVLSELPIYIEDTPGLSISEVRSKARRLHAENGIHLVMIDYLQLMSGRRSDNRVQEVSEISRGLKALARELNVPLIALSQLSRAVEGRQSHVPMLSDLRESGCLVGESLVYLPDAGCYRRIDALIGKTGFNVLALNTATWQLEPRPVTNAFCTGVKQVYRLTTRLGHSIRATANHKFLTTEGWQRLDTLTQGQHLALPRRLFSTSQATMSDDELALLGLLLGDGCTLARQQVHFTTADADTAALAAERAMRIFGDAVTPRVSQECSWYQVSLSARARLTDGVRNPIAHWLSELGVFDLRSHKKHVPERVFAQPDAQIAHFLRHLWATDGCMHISQHSAFTVQHSEDVAQASGTHRPSAPEIYYATSSERLARDVQSLLLRFGINAILRRLSQGDNGRDQFHVDVSGTTDQTIFLEQIGAIGKRNMSQRLVVAAGEAQAVGCGALGLLAESDVYWDEVVRIEPDGEEIVFDLTVDGLHNFVVNDMVSHNSIEQDADIVMFIYREELYDKETDKKGIAEIHLAKHRNGPLGIVPLRFEARTTRFQNLERYRAPEGY
jgi:replicative DNA helicase